MKFVLVKDAFQEAQPTNQRLEIGDEGNNYFQRDLILRCDPRFSENCKLDKTVAAHLKLPGENSTLQLNIYIRLNKVYGKRTVSADLNIYEYEHNVKEILDLFQQPAEKSKLVLTLDTGRDMFTFGCAKGATTDNAWSYMDAELSRNAVFDIMLHPEEIKFGVTLDCTDCAGSKRRSDIASFNLLKLTNGQFYDLEIESNQKESHFCHREFVAAKSDVIHQMLKSEFSEARMRKVVMNFSTSAVRLLLKYMYDDMLDLANTSSNTTIEVLRASDYYGMRKLFDSIICILYEKPLEWFSLSSALEGFSFIAKYSHSGTLDRLTKKFVQVIVRLYLVTENASKLLSEFQKESVFAEAWNKEIMNRCCDYDRRAVSLPAE